MKDSLTQHQEEEDDILIAEEADIRSRLSSFQYPQYFSLPVSVQFELTSGCNLHCKHCYNPGTVNGGSELSNEDWINFLEDLISRGGVFEAILSGGEPLLLGDTLIEMMKKLSKDGAHLVLLSNGLLFDDAFVEEIADLKFYWIQISIHGDTASLHDTFTNCEGAFNKAIKAALKVSQRGLPLFIAHTVTPENLERLPSMVETAYQLGATSIIVGQASPSGEAFRTNERILLNRNEKNILIQRANELAQSYKNMSVMLASSNWFQLKRNTLYPNTGFIVRPNGDMRLDCMTPFVMGNIKDDDWLKVWQEKGSHVWQHYKVQEFISGVQRDVDINPTQRNFLDKDVKI